MIGHCKECSSKPHTQDQIHGPGNRVLNQHKRKNGLTTTAIVTRCTRCGHETITTTSNNDKKD